ncbi:MAG: DsbA family protein [Carboxylicivirga sp.]|nr:DsbA family protein [Carboxylicivirga sp.]
MVLVMRISLMLFMFNISVWSQKQNNMVKLKYVMDPHCGWCYGNSENMIWLEEQLQNKLNIEIVVGGMWLGSNAPLGGNEFSHFIQSHSPQMEQRTGAIVSESFYDLAKNTTYTFSSLEPSAAIVLVKQIMPEKALLFAKELQKATFLSGHRLDEIATYTSILKRLGLDEADFTDKWLKVENVKATEAEFKTSRQLARSYPTLLIEINDEIRPLASGYFNKEEVLNKIEEHIRL